MRIGRFIAFLLILFLGAFWWAGGSKLMPEFTPKLPAIAQYDRHIEQAEGAWERIYRVIALKSAVNSKLNKQKYVKIHDIPLTLQQAIIAVEDNRFYRHIGFDVEGILRALLVNLQAGALEEGGSTITQQLVKNLFLSQERTLTRKVEEVVLAIDMELRYSKEEILEMYLNTIYFGSGAYGINDAARIYFAKSPASLTLAESSLLAGLPNAPSIFSPYDNYNAAKQRQAVVLAAMVKQSYLGPNQAEEAKTAPLKLAR